MPVPTQGGQPSDKLKWLYEKVLIFSAPRFETDGPHWHAKAWLMVA